MAEGKHTQEAIQEIEKLQDELDRLKKEIDQSYYSIPKKEFESITVTKITSAVTDQMNKRLNTVRNWLGVILVLLSFFGISQWPKLKESIQNSIEQDIKNVELQLNASIQQRLDQIEGMIENTLGPLRENQIEIREKLDEKLRRFSISIDETILAAKRATDSALKSVRADIQFSQKIFLKAELKELKNEVNARTLGYEIALIKLDPLLRQVIQLDDKELTNEFLDMLFRLTFQLDRYEELDKLRVQYEKDFDFKPETWANIAIGDMFLYEESYALNYKARALAAYEKSLERLPNYGVAYAVRLIIHMIDYVRQSQESVKKMELSEAQQLLQIVNGGSRQITAYEAFNYLQRLENDYAIGKFINMLFINFPEEMKTMSDRHQQWLQAKKSLKQQ